MAMKRQDVATRQRTRKARRLQAWLLLAGAVRSNKPNIASLHRQKNTDELLSAGAATHPAGSDRRLFVR
jgi:hypothetical protein